MSGVAAGVLSAPVDVLVLPDRPRFSAVAEKRDLRSALHSTVCVALVCDLQISCRDLHPALSGRVIVESPPIAERERRDVFRDSEPSSSTVAAVLNYQVVAVLQVTLILICWMLPAAQTSPPFGWMMVSDCPQYFPPVLKNSCRRDRPKRSFHFRSRPPGEGIGSGALVVLVAVQVFVLGIVSPAGVRIAADPTTPDDHFAAGPDGGVIPSGSRRVGGADGHPRFVLGIRPAPAFKA